MKGKFIVFDGGDGSGKDTQLGRAYDWMKDNDYPVVLTSEPWEDVDSGQEFRRALKNKELCNDWKYMTDLINRNRYEHDTQFIRKQLDLGVNVFTGRYRSSTFTYQPATGAPIEYVKETDARYQHTRPDMTLIFTAPMDILVERVKKREDEKGTSGEWFDKHLPTMEKIVQNFDELEQYLDENIVRIDTVASKQEVHMRVMDKIVPILPPKQI